MKINNQEIKIDEITKNINNDFLKKRENGLILRDRHIEILKRNNINYECHITLSSLIFEIEEILNEGLIDEELESLCEELSEINYYNYTNK